MSLSLHQIKTIKKAFKSALNILFRPEPMTAVEHADKNFYMSPESSYIEGDWTTVGYQVAILNAIGNDEVQEVDFPKAARTGWTKLLCAAINYFVDHKQRNIGVWQPNDTMRDRFSKQHVDTMIRDVKPLRKLFPWWGKKHKHNTKANKSFLNFCQLHLLGAESPNNFRELSLDVAMTDESGSYKMDVGDEGDALGLIEKRLEGSAFSKFVNGSSPTIKGKCLITKRAEHCEQHFYRYIPCPRCGNFQILEFGGKKTKHGLKWDKTLTGAARNKSAHYVCKHCDDKFQYVEYLEADKLGYYQSTQGLLTFDGIEYFDAETRELVQTPETIAFMGIWTAYSHFAPWWKIVRDWYQDKGTAAGLKKFTNTTLGQAWEEETGEKNTAESLMLRREMYKAQVPKNAGATGGIESIAAYALDTSTEVISKTLTIASANSSNATISVNFSDSDSFLTSDPLVEKLAPTYTVVISRSKNGGAFVPIKTLSVHGNITMVERPNVNSYYHTLDLVGDLSFIDTTHGSVSGQALAYSVAINKTSSAGWSNAPIASALSIAQSAQGGGSSAYVLPKASSTTLGGVKLTVTDGVLNITTD